MFNVSVNHKHSYDHYASVSLRKFEKIVQLQITTILQGKNNTRKYLNKLSINKHLGTIRKNIYL